MEERLSIAPMMEWTDAHYRMLMRGLTKKTVLYTEMVVDDSIIHGPGLDFFVGRNIEEEPSIIQLGGYDAEKLGKASEICARYLGEYGELNLNCGCPSPRVAKRSFGAKLMLEPELVRELVYSMQRHVNIPVSVKCRIGADEMDSYDHLVNFIQCARAGGVRKFVVHARKCILSGLNPKQNREVPPLHYEVVHKLVQDFPELKFVINGGIQNFQQAREHLDISNGGYKYSIVDDTAYNLKKMRLLGKANINRGEVIDAVFADVIGTDANAGSIVQEWGDVLPAVHGVMLGRAAYNNPMQFATADSEFYGVRDPCLSRRELLERYIKYCEWCQSDDGPQYYLVNNANGGTNKKAVPPSSSPRVVGCGECADDAADGATDRLTVDAAEDGAAYSLRAPETGIADGKSVTAASPRRKVVSTSVLLNAMRNVMHGLANNQLFRKQLNDVYVDKLKGLDASNPNPNVREVIEEAMSVMKDEDLYLPLGNPHANEDVVKTYVKW